MSEVNKQKLNENITLEQMINDFSSVNDKKIKRTRIERKYDKYSKKFKEKFGRNPYIAEPTGTKEQTIKAIKMCLEKNEDILDKLLYPDENKFIY